MSRQGFKVGRLHALLREPSEDPGLAAAGIAVKQYKLESRVGGRVPAVEIGNDLSPPGLIPALEPGHRPTDLLHDSDHGGRSLASAPAVDQRTKISVTICQRRLEMTGDITGDVGRSDAAREKF